jgi:hypothetical protein
MSKLLTLLLAAAVLVPFPLARAEAAPPPQTMSLDMQQMIPMRDGVHLAAMIWKPAHITKPLTTVMLMTPYMSQNAQKTASQFVQAGYAFVAVDVRGRGNSEGAFTPLRGNGPDGADVIEWLARQPWSDGRVAMMGGSYLGMVQWQVMAEHPKHLVAAMPTAAVYPGFDFPVTRGIGFPYAIQWLAFTSGRTTSDEVFGDDKFWLGKWVDAYEAKQPLSALADAAGTNRGAFLQWLDHHAYDAYWEAYNPKPADYAGIHIPILTTTGYFDADQPGALRYYQEFMRYAPADARAHHYLLMGPWDHAGTRQPQKQLGGLSFAENSVLDMRKLQIDWLDWVLKGGKRPEALSDKVNYYAWGEGADEWRHAASLEGLSSHASRLYFSSPGGPADDAYHAGQLVDAPLTDEAPDSFVSDPDKLQDAATLMAMDEDDYLTSPRDAFGGNRVVYMSGPLPHAEMLAGWPRISASIALDTQDVDLGADLQLLLPDGKMVLLGSDVVRARFRRDITKETAVTPGAVEEYLFDGFYYMVRQLPQGARIRVVVYPIDDPNIERNYNSGGRPGYEKASDAKVAHVSLHLDAAHPSYLELPLAPQ